MRGEDHQQSAMFSYISPEQRVPANHPLRKLRRLVDTVLTRLSPSFTTMYARIGRPSIAPEKLLRALLLQFLYTIRSERLLMEELDYNMLFRWFVGLNLDDPVWDATVYAKNRERLLKHKVAESFFQQVTQLAGEHDLLSDEHFTVDGTLIEAWAGIKSFKKKEDSPPPPDPPAAPPSGATGDPGNPEVNFHGEKLKNETHQSTTDKEARLYKKAKGKEAKLGYLGHVVTENRNGLVVNAEVTLATGKAEREAALDMMEEREGQKRVTLGGDKNYDVRDFVEKLRGHKVTPHVAQNTKGRSSAIDARTTRHPGYAVSQRKRKRVEEVFGWLKTVALMRKVRHRGRKLVQWMFTLAAAAYNLVRIRNLVGAEG
jgi:transposase